MGNHQVLIDVPSAFLTLTPQIMRWSGPVWSSRSVRYFLADRNVSQPYGGGAVCQQS